MEDFTKVYGIPNINRKYHVCWASNGVVGVCKSIDIINKTVILISPKTKKPFKNPVKWEDLRHIRNYQLNIK